MLDILPGINSTTAALNAERIRIDVVGQNIANLNTTHGPDGKPYQRQQVVFETLFQQAREIGGAPLQSVTVARIEKDQRPPKMVYEPGHPDANSEGMVALPDINMAALVLLLEAGRRDLVTVGARTQVHLVAA